MTGWAVLAAVGTAYDVWAYTTHHETLTSAFKRTWRHPTGRLVIAAGLTVAAVHLFEQ